MVDTTAPRIETATLTALSVLAFAGNSLLCRLALQPGTGPGDIDPAGFTLLRIGAGALVLWALAGLASARARRAPALHATVTSPPRLRRYAGAALLFAYALAFSLAYVQLGAAVGALLLFGSVQLTMLLVGLATGERPTALRWAGMLAALGGLGWLLLPGAGGVALSGAVLMVLAGAAWGGYSLLGRGSAAPLQDTARAFLGALPLAAAAALLALPSLRFGVQGVVLALVSGALASGLGYAVWYRALRGLSTSSAAVVQLAVPAVTALGAVWLLDEVLHARLVFASAVVLGGVALALLAGSRPLPVAPAGHRTT